MSRALKRIAVGALGGFGAVALGFWAWGIRMPAVPLPELPGTLQRDSIEVGGHDRTFSYYIPRNLPSAPTLLLALHGSGMDGLTMRRFTGHGFDAIAEREGLVVAYPDGWDRNWNDCRPEGDFEARRLDIDDVAFMRGLVDWFVRGHGVARGRVFVAGVSNGGQLAFRVALETPDLVRGIASVAASMPVGGGTCQVAGRAVPTLIMNGTDDPLNPYEGGQVALWGFIHRRGLVESTMASARYWAELAGHDGAPRREAMPDRDPQDGTTGTRLTWTGGGGPDVVLMSVRGGGHALPHPRLSMPRLFGRTSHDFSAAEEIWRFFRQQLRADDE